MGQLGLTLRDELIYNEIWKHENLEPSELVRSALNFIPIHKDQLILDLGCGNGKNSFLFATFGCKVTAVDYNLETLGMVANRLNNVAIVNDNIISFATSHTDKQFDFIILHDVLHHLSTSAEGIIEACQSINKLLVNGGHIVLSLLCDIQYSKGQLPENRFYVHTASGRRLIHRTYKGFNLKMSTLKKVFISNSFNIEYGHIVSCSYQATRLGFVYKK